MSERRSCLPLGVHWPWPLTIPGLGDFAGGRPYARCAMPGCGTFTWVTYGALAVCLEHALRSAA